MLKYGQGYYLVCMGRQSADETPKGQPEYLAIGDPVKISKQGKRYYIEIPKQYHDTIQDFRGKPLLITLRAIDYSKL